MVYEGNEKYIFVSYSHRDSAAVVPFIEAMQKEGFRVWYDKGIEAGTEWPEYIAEHLENCECFVAFLSRYAVKSKNCRQEINRACDLDKQFLSVYLEEVELTPGMRLRISSSQAMFRDRCKTDEEFLDQLFTARILQCCRATPDASVEMAPEATPAAPETPATPAAPAAPAAPAGGDDSSISVHIDSDLAARIAAARRQKAEDPTPEQTPAPAPAPEAPPAPPAPAAPVESKPEEEGPDRLAQLMAALAARKSGDDEQTPAEPPAPPAPPEPPAPAPAPAPAEPASHDSDGDGEDDRLAQLRAALAARKSGGGEGESAPVTPAEPPAPPAPPAPPTPAPAPAPAPAPVEPEAPEEEETDPARAALEAQIFAALRASKADPEPEQPAPQSAPHPTPVATLPEPEPDSEPEEEETTEDPEIGPKCKALTKKFVILELVAAVVCLIVINRVTAAGSTFWPVLGLTVLPRVISTIISLVLFEKGKVGLTKAEEDDATGAQYGMMMISVILVTIISVFCIVTGENAFIRILIALGLGVASAACAFATAVVKEMFS